MPDDKPEDQTESPEDRPFKMPRRGMMFWLAGGVGMAAGTGITIPVIGYLLGVLGHRPTIWVPIGKVTQFPINETRLTPFVNAYKRPWDGITANTGAWVRNMGVDSEGNHQFTIFAMNCAHLGCAVSWFPESQLFMCPCHGGIYYANGERAAGPPPRGLYKMPWRVVGDTLEVQSPHFPSLHDTLDHPSDLVQLGVIRRDCEGKA